MNSNNPPCQKPIRFAIIGCGHIGKRHLEMVMKDGRGSVVALCDIKNKSSLNLPETAQGIPFYNDYKLLLEEKKDEADIVSVCVPNGCHAEIGEAVLDAGIHALIEKPIVLWNDEAERLKKAQRESGKKIFGVLQNRYTPSSRWLKGLIESGRLGKIYHVKLDCLWNRDQRYYLPKGWHGDLHLDGGTLFTQYSHFIDLLTWWFGPIDTIEYARYDNFNHKDMIDFEDSGDICFDFASGSKGSIHYSTAVFDHNMEIALTMLAENGAIKIGGPFLNKVEQCTVKDYTMPEVPASRPGNQYGGYSGSAQNHHLVIGNVISSLLGEEAEIVTLEDALSVVHTIRKFYDFSPKMKELLRKRKQ